MSTWQLFPDSSGDGFRWEVAGRIIQSADSDSTLESTAPLPSMADLLLQGDSFKFVDAFCHVTLRFNQLLF